jgi:hypothetical protein
MIYKDFIKIKKKREIIEGNYKNAYRNNSYF